MNRDQVSIIIASNQMKTALARNSKMRIAACAVEKGTLLVMAGDGICFREQLRLGYNIFQGGTILGTRYLEDFFQPRSIAVIGASELPDSLGGVVLRNLIASGFRGALYVVSRRAGREVYGIQAYKKIKKLPETPDLAIICTPPTIVPRMVKLLGRIGVKAALVLMGGMTRALSRSGRPLKESTLAAARPWGLRIMGPNCLGLLAPAHHMNASYAHLDVNPGRIAFVGQSAVLGSAVIDWSRDRDLGFSHFLTLGDSMDVDLADVIDYLAADRNTKALLLHIEEIRDAARFISAVRTAALTKPVLAVKAPRFPDDLPVPRGLTSREPLWQEVMRRTGVLQVGGVEEMFAGLEALNRIKRFPGNRLALICNGMGVALLTIDYLERSGGSLAKLSEATRSALTAVLPSRCNAENPVDLHIDADPKRYGDAVSIIAADPGVDAVLVIHAPTLVGSGEAFARALIDSEIHCPLLTCWIGAASVGDARAAFKEAGLPSFHTPERAVEAFMARVRHDRRQDLLRQTPPALPDDEHRKKARAVLDAARAADRDVLLPMEARALLEAYRIPVAQTWFHRDLESVIQTTEDSDKPMALKIVDSSHCRPFAYHEQPQKYRRGVARQLDGPGAIRRAAARLEAGLDGEKPMGYLVQTMRSGLDTVLVSMGMTRDCLFGPIMFCGEGGPLFNVLDDRKVSLPPLNMNLARDLVNRTRVARLIDANTNDGSAHKDALARMMTALARLVTDFPEIDGLEINPFLFKGDEHMVLDVVVSLGKPVPSVIRPYPHHLIETTTLPRSGRTVTLRPIRGEDEPAHSVFAAGLSPEAIRYRFFHSISGLSHKQLANLTQVDYDREMAFIATTPNPEGNPETLGVVRAWTDSDNISAEFAVIVRDDQYGEGLGRTLLDKMIRYCRRQGTLEMVGTILPENHRMKGLAKRMGFKSWYDRDNGAVAVCLPLNEPTDEWQRTRLTSPMENSHDQTH